MPFIIAYGFASPYLVMMMISSISPAGVSLTSFTCEWSSMLLILCLDPVIFKNDLLLDLQFQHELQIWFPKCLDLSETNFNFVNVS